MEMVLPPDGGRLSIPRSEDRGLSPQFGKFDKAAQLFDNIIIEERFVEFLTLPAYQYLP